MILNALSIFKYTVSWNMLIISDDIICIMLFSDSKWIQGNVGIQPLDSFSVTHKQYMLGNPGTSAGSGHEKNDLLVQVIPITVVDDIYIHYL